MQRYKAFKSGQTQKHMKQKTKMKNNPLASILLSLKLYGFLIFG